MKFCKNIVIITIFSITLTSCFGKDADLFGPDPIFMKNLPQGNDPFSIGFRDGCRNIIGNVGYGMQRFVAEPTRPEYIGNPDYKKGYKEGDRYCSIYVNKSIFL